MTMNDEDVFGRIKMGVNVDIKRSDGKSGTYFAPTHSLFPSKTFLFVKTLQVLSLKYPAISPKF
jgi:hypothetical protein